MHKTYSYLRFCFFLVAAIAVLYSCANMASPTGGRYDVNPPVVKKATPDFNSLNIKKQRIEIEFDENVKIEKPNEKVIITPPQQTMPVIKSIGRKVVVELNDDLKENTTYTIDFTDAIVDNNEGNPLENFSLSFSTGDKIDTMAIAGKVLAAENLEPMPGIYVGMHSNHADTMFTKQPFERIGRTDSRGSFTVKGVAKGAYRVFALKDANRDFKYDSPLEEIAFLDSIITPTSMPATRQDTIFNPKDSTQIDTIKTIHYTRFMPDDMVLRAFKSDFQRQYLQKTERPQQHLLHIYFAAPTQPPHFSLIAPQPAKKDWYVEERSQNNDSITLWITDSMVYKQDSIRLELKYIRTDSLNKNNWETDTIKFNFKKPKETPKKKKDGDKEPEVRFLNIKHTIQQTHEIYQPIHLEFEEPIILFDSVHVKLAKMVDSVYQNVNYRLQRDSLNSRKYTIRNRWEAGAKYKFSIDSAVFKSHYGLINNKVSQEFTIKKLDQYGNLKFVLSGLPDGKDMYVELLDKSDKPFRKTLVKNNEALFMDLNPGTIYARLFIDENKDGSWTTGNYEKKRQPEIVYYYPQALEIRAFTDLTQSWNATETPLDKQKPKEITKNKPEERKRRNLNEERERERTQNQQQSSPFSGMGPNRMMQGGMR